MMPAAAVLLTASGAVALRGGAVALSGCCGCGQFMRFTPCEQNARDPACGVDDEPPEAVIYVALSAEGVSLVSVCDGAGMPTETPLSIGDTFLYEGWCYRYDSIGVRPGEDDLVLVGGCVTLAPDGCADDLCAGPRYYVGERCYCGCLGQMLCRVIGCKTALDALFDHFGVDCVTLRVEGLCPPPDGPNGFACTTFSRSSPVVIGAESGDIRANVPPEAEWGGFDITQATCCDCCACENGCSRYKSPGGVPEDLYTYVCPPNTTNKVSKYLNCCCDPGSRQWTFTGTVEQIFEVNCEPDPARPPIWVEYAHVNGVASRFNDEARIDYTGFSGASCGSAGSDFTYRSTTIYDGSCDPKSFPRVGTLPFNPPYDFGDLGNVILLECLDEWDMSCSHWSQQFDVWQIITTDPPVQYQQYRTRSRWNLRFEVTQPVSLCEKQCSDGGGDEGGGLMGLVFRVVGAARRAMGRGLGAGGGGEAGGAFGGTSGGGGMFGGGDLFRGLI